jgi:UDP-glucuronate decarboxylase
MSKILITGGAGFLGSHLVEQFIEDNEIVVIDNFSTGRRQNLEKYEKNIEVIRHDVTIPIFLEVDLILNFACPASPIQYQKNPVQTLKTCVQGAINMLGLAKRTGARIIQASTSEVYGDPESSPQEERYWGRVNPIGIRSCHDEGKRAAETLFSDYKRQYDVDIRIARIFNTYGPNMAADDGRVVSNFIVQALRSENLTIYGDGSQTRSFCYVDDLVKGIKALALCESLDVHQPVNLGNPNSFTMLELAETVIRITNSSSRIEFFPLPDDDPRQRKPDITRAQQLLNWAPTVELEQGLQRTTEYFDNLITKKKIEN